MNFAIDFGNTFAKCGVFDGEKIVEYHDQLQNGDLDPLINKIKPVNIIISTVNQRASSLINDHQPEINWLVLDSTTAIPIVNKYHSKKTLGNDRLAAVVGGNYLFPNKNLLIIDAGTSITYDIIESPGTYLGGAISPGIKMKFYALHEYTQQLPLVDADELNDLVGNDTKSCIASGVVNGTIAEMLQMIRMYRSKFADLQILVCGGDAKYLKGNLLMDATFVPELVLIGLNRILKYNVENT